MRWLLSLALLGTLAAAQAPPAVTVVSRTHPSVVQSFDESAAPFLPLDLEDEPPGVDHALVPAEGRGQVLRITNRVAGGFVGTQVLRGRRDTPFYTHLAFDYQADSNLKVNLTARVDYQDYEFGLFGPPCDTGRSTWMGRPGEPVADGKWHRYELPLLRWIRTVKPATRAPRLQSLTISNQHHGDYLLAGFGGNPQGSRLLLDNFELYRPGPPAAAFELSVPRGTALDGFSVVHDRDADTVPAETVSTNETTLTIDGLTDGVWYLHARAKLTGGGWGPTTHYRFVVDTAPPAADAIAPAPNEVACPEAWSCRLTDAGVGVAPQSLVVAVTEGEPKFIAELADPNQAETVTELSAADPAVAYDPVSGKLQVFLNRLKRRFADGDTVGIAVRAADENGATMEPLRAGFKLRFADDRAAPTGARLMLRLPGQDTPIALPGEGTFEHGLDEWQVFDDTGSFIERTTDTAASGRYSLRLRCTENASNFAVMARKTPFDAKRFRVLSFDYKVTDRLRVDWVVKVNNEYVFIRFTDRDQDELVITDGVPAIVADNQWHHCELPLYELLRRRFPNETRFEVGMVLLTGGPFGGAARRHPGNYAGTEYFIDNFMLVPMLGADTRMEWVADDTVGVAGAEVVTADSPAGLPTDDAATGRRIEGSGVPLETLDQGLVYFWARLLDPAGNRSEPVMTRFLVDAGRPTVGDVWPADGSRVAPRNLGVQLRDDRGAGLDLGSVVLEVDGKPYRVDGSVLRYDAGGGRLIWDGGEAREPIRFANGQQVAVKLLEAVDLAGNRPERLPSWSFTVDFALDREGPLPRISSTTHASHLQEGFEADPAVSLRVEPAGAANAELQPDDRGGRALRITPGGGPWACWLDLATPCIGLRFQYLRFDYRLPAGAAVDLLIAGLRGDEVDVRAARMTDDNTSLEVVGAVPDIIADGQWHTALVPLDDLAKAAGWPSPRKIAAIGLGDQGAAAPAGEVWIDNVAMLRQPSTGNVKLRWEAGDISGVQGYSVVFDQNPLTIPAETVSTTDTALELRDLPPGAHFLHLRVLDGAGNWGPTAHYVIMIRRPGGP